MQNETFLVVLGNRKEETKLTVYGGKTVSLNYMHSVVAQWNRTTKTVGRQVVGPPMAGRQGMQSRW